MTEKYKLEISEPHIEDTETGECYDLHGKDNLMYIVELWNKIADENKQLKQFQEKVARVIEGKMEDNICNNYKMEVLKEIWNELNLDEVWFE